MDKIDIENISLQSIAQKVNEIVDAVNFYNQYHIEELEKQRNELMYGKYMTDKQVIEDMKSRLKSGEYAININQFDGGENK